MVCWLVVLIGWYEGLVSEHLESRSDVLLSAFLVSPPHTVAQTDGQANEFPSVIGGPPTHP